MFVRSTPVVDRRTNGSPVGVVNEALPHDRAVDRGIEIAKLLSAKPALFHTMQKQTLNMNLRRRIVRDVPFGMVLEGLTTADQPYRG